MATLDPGGACQLAIDDNIIIGASSGIEIHDRGELEGIFTSEIELEDLNAIEILNNTFINYF